MENQNPSLKQIALNYGGLLALVSILMLVIMYVANIDQSWILSILGWIITIALFVQAIKTYRQSNGGFLSVGEAIKTGLAVAAVAGIITAIYTYVHYTYVYPEFIDAAVDTAREAMLKQNPDMPQDQMDMALSMTEKFTTPFVMATMSLIGNLFFGFIISIIAGLILQRRNPNQV